MNLEQIGGRKAVAFLITMAAGVVTHILSKQGLTSEVSYFLMGTLAVFVGGNGMEHVAGALKKPGTPELYVTTAPQVESAESLESALKMVEALAETKQSVAETKRAVEATLAGVTYVVDHIQKSSGQ